MERYNNIKRLSPRPPKVVPFAWGSHSDWSNSHSDSSAGSHTAWGCDLGLLGPHIGSELWILVVLVAAYGAGCGVHLGRRKIVG